MSNISKNKDVLLRAALKRRILRDRKSEKEKDQRMDARWMNGIVCRKLKTDYLKRFNRSKKVATMELVQDKFITSSDHDRFMHPHCIIEFIFSAAEWKRNEASYIADNQAINNGSRSPLPKVDFRLQHSATDLEFPLDIFSSMTRLN